MRFVSTRGESRPVTLSQAIVDGIAPDGGLYVPEHLPSMATRDFEGADALPSVAGRLLRPFAAGDLLEPAIDAVCDEAFDFAVPLVALKAPGAPSVLELFHGPTCAFKDVGARFLAAALGRIRGREEKLTVLVATSGDTGGAVAAAFHRVSWADVVLLYPKGLVSPSQAQQLACWGDNVSTFAVLGTFDDCQRMVKEAFRDVALARTFRLSSANSINVGRLLPQMAYYAWASLTIWRRQGRKASFIVPTGNLGNAAACVMAREIGLPIGDVVLATNANRVIVDFLETGAWSPRSSVATLASAMDVGNPSNLERLRWYFPDLPALRARVSAHAVSDDEIRAVIRSDAADFGRVWCPHSATAAAVHRRVAGGRSARPWVIVATAHPAKFSEIVDPLVGGRVSVPPALERLRSLPLRVQDLPPTLEALRGQLYALAR